MQNLLVSGQDPLVTANTNELIRKLKKMIEVGGIRWEMIQNDSNCSKMFENHRNKWHNVFESRYIEYEIVFFGKNELHQANIIFFSSFK